MKEEYTGLKMALNIIEKEQRQIETDIETAKREGDNESVRSFCDQFVIVDHLRRLLSQAIVEACV